MAERTTSAEDTQNQQCQCVHANVDRLIDRSACLVESALGGAVVLLPVLVHPSHLARPAPRPVAARKYPPSARPCWRSLLPRCSFREPLFFQSSPSLRALVTTRCFRQLLVSFLLFVWSSRAPSFLLTCLSSNRDLLALRCRAIMSRLEQLGCKLLCCNCHATSRPTSCN